LSQIIIAIFLGNAGAGIGSLFDQRTDISVFDNIRRLGPGIDIIDAAQVVVNVFRDCYQFQLMFR
jgi:hypothetical protein